MRKIAAYLDVTASTVQIQVQVLHLAKFGESIFHILLCRLFMNTSHHDNPTLHSWGMAEARKLWVGAGTKHEA